MRLPSPARGLGLLVALLLLWHGEPSAAQAQDILEQFRTARVQAQAERAARTVGLRLAPLGPGRITMPWDSLFVEVESLAVATPAAEAVPVNPFLGATWKSIRRLQRGSYARTFEQTKWAYMGSTTVAWLDTVWTRELRARLETRFGRPTSTLSDFYRERGDSLGEYIQFQYWVLVNDSIPAMIMDAGGPFERSVVLAVDERYRSSLPHLRAALAAELSSASELGTYTDYYFEPSGRQWYQTGYDGARFYTERAGPPPAPRRPPEQGSL